MTGQHRPSGRSRRWAPVAAAAAIAVALAGAALARPVSPARLDAAPVELAVPVTDGAQLGQWCFDRKAQGTAGLSLRAKAWLVDCIKLFHQPQPTPSPSVSPSASPTPDPSPSSSPSTSPSPTPSESPTASPSPTPTGPPAPGGLNLPRIPWDGGSAYWAQFPKANAAGWADPTFFPVADWIGQRESAAAELAIGINTYMAVEHSGALATATSTGMFVFPQQGEWTQAEVGNDPKAVGWFVSDECEMGYSGCLDSNDEFGRLAVQQSYVDRVRAFDDGRFAWSNFGNGITRTWWAPTTMDQFVQSVDGASADKYAYTSPAVQNLLSISPRWPAGANPESAAAYGWQVDQMRSFHVNPGDRPVWAFIEAGRPYLTEAGAGTITPDQMEGAVWSSIIHEARGVTFFRHDNSGRSCASYNILLNCADVRAKVMAVTADLRALAPVINSQSYVWGFGPGTDAMLKAYNDAAYIFAGIGLLDSPGSKTFTLPPGVTGTTVEVLGEGRTLPVVDGEFTDAFAAEYTHHVYRVVL